MKFEWINKIFIIWSSSPSLFFLVLTHNIYNWISFLFLLCYMYVIVMIVSWLDGSCKYNQRYNSHIHDDDDEDHVSIDDGINKWIFNPKKKKQNSSISWLRVKKTFETKSFLNTTTNMTDLYWKKFTKSTVCVCVFVIWWGQMNERKKIFGDNKFCFLVIKTMVWWRWSRWKKIRGQHLIVMWIYFSSLKKNLKKR